MNLTVKDVTEKLGMTPHTVRYYCDMGLVPNLQHDKHGNRIFDEESLKWLKAAASMREYGMPIAKIRDYFALCQKGNSTFQERYEILLTLKNETEAKLNHYRQQLEIFNREAANSKRLYDELGIDDCNPMNWMI